MMLDPELARGRRQENRMRTVSSAGVVTEAEDFSPRVQEALGDLVGAAKEGLLALSVGVGLGVLESSMSEEVDELCGPEGSS